MTRHFFNEFLHNAPVRISGNATQAQLLLDKNEQSQDVDFLLKNKALNVLMATNWNRYPDADLQDLEMLVANYCGLDAENIVLSPGSASLITTLLNYFGLNQKRIVIAQPSYTLFDYHCKTFNIRYEPWMLNSELEYDYENMPTLGAGDVLIITTPNNPVGNCFDPKKLVEILEANPDAYIIVDAVYAEFCSYDYTSLVKKHPNLIVLRSFSKAFPIAGLRLGYGCAAPQTIAILRKLMLPFSINHFTQVFARTILFNPECQDCSQKMVKTVIAERERMYQLLHRHFDRNTLKVFPSDGNFLLIRVHQDASFQKLVADLETAGIKVLNCSPFSMLQNCLRVSIGAAEENDFFIQKLADSLDCITLRHNASFNPPPLAALKQGIRLAS
ncbi:MAG: histidinol-phosphate aminotransferase family protein [Chitinophagales bacterium]|nr:histidinol-phosphate aminotransferase family protein [Chitinophagales bacterium]